MPKTDKPGGRHAVAAARQRRNDVQARRRAKALRRDATCQLTCVPGHHTGQLRTECPGCSEVVK